MFYSFFSDSSQLAQQAGAIVVHAPLARAMAFPAPPAVLSRLLARAAGRPRARAIVVPRATGLLARAAGRPLPHRL